MMRYRKERRLLMITAAGAVLFPSASHGFLPFLIGIARGLASVARVTGVVSRGSGGAARGVRASRQYCYSPAS